MCFDFQQLYLYRYPLLMKMRLVSNYGKCYFHFLDIQQRICEGEKNEERVVGKTGLLILVEKKRQIILTFT